MTTLPLSMRRNCNLELRLSPSSTSFSAASHSHHPPAAEESNQSPQSQPLTIFYNGRICVCDVTEFQARAILMLATREMEDKLMKIPNGSEPSSPKLYQSQPQTPTTPGIYMKRSLQRFLQKRKHRVQATSPYHH